VVSVGSTLGGLGVGCIAPGQEVLAETTYPADQTVGLALMSLFGFVKGTFLMLIENVMGEDLTPEEMEIQVCVSKQNGTYPEEEGKLHPMNHSTFIYFATGYMFFMTLLFGLFFNTKLKRTMADEGELDLKDVLKHDDINDNNKSDKEIQLESNQFGNTEDKPKPKMVSIELSDIKPNLKSESRG
jgi:hypothetical protein